MEFDITTMTPCECDPTKPNPCGPGSDCINRYFIYNISKLPIKVFTEFCFLLFLILN